MPLITLVKFQAGRLRQFEEATFLEQCLKIAVDLGGPALGAPNALAAFAEQTAALQGKLAPVLASAYTKEMQDADRARDTELSGFRLGVHSAMLFESIHPNGDTPGTFLWKIMEHYRQRRHWNYQEESAILEHLVAELSEGRAAECVAKLNLGQWVRGLAELNEAFGKAFMARVSEAAAREKVNVPALLAAANGALAVLLQVTAGGAAEGSNAACARFIDTYNELAGKYKLLLKHRKGKGRWRRAEPEGEEAVLVEELTVVEAVETLAPPLGQSDRAAG